MLAAIGALTVLGLLAAVGLAISLGERKPLPPCARYQLDTPAWVRASLRSEASVPTLREVQADTLVGCNRIDALSMAELTHLLGPPPDGALGHPGYNTWSYPLAFVPGRPGVPRSVLTISFATGLVASSAIVTFGSPALHRAPVGPTRLPPGAGIPGSTR